MISSFKLGDCFDQKFNVTEAVVDKFIDISKDNNILHVNNEFAIGKGFKSKVVQGNLQNCFLSFFIGECLPSKHVMIISQTINYKNPVYINDTLFLNVVISGVSSSVNVIEFKFKFKNNLNQIVSNGKINIKLLT